MTGTPWKARVSGTVLLAAALLVGTVGAQEETGILEDGYESGIYDDDDASNDWFFDSYAELDDGVLHDSRWETGHAFFSGAYDDGVTDNDWFFDSYEDPGDQGFWDV